MTNMGRQQSRSTLEGSPWGQGGPLGEALLPQFSTTTLIRLTGTFLLGEDPLSPSGPICKVLCPGAMSPDLYSLDAGVTMRAQGIYDCLITPGEGQEGLWWYRWEGGGQVSAEGAFEVRAT